MPSSVVDYQASLRARADALTLAQWLATADPETLFPNREEFEQAGESHASDPEVIDWLPFDGSGNGYAIRPARDLFMAQHPEWDSPRWNAAAKTLSEGAAWRQQDAQDFELERAARHAVKNIKRESQKPVVFPWIVSMSAQSGDWDDPIHWSSGAISRAGFEAAVDETPLPAFLSGLSSAVCRALFAESLKAQMASRFPHLQIELEKNLPGGGRGGVDAQSWTLALKATPRRDRAREREPISDATAQEVLTTWIGLLRNAVGEQHVGIRPLEITTRRKNSMPSRATDDDMRQWMAQADAVRVQKELRELVAQQSASNGAVTNEEQATQRNSRRL